MKFNVELTEQADKDLRSIYLYIVKPQTPPI